VNDQKLQDVIKDRYGKIARGEQTFCCPSCGPTTTDQCLAVGYTAEDLALVPEMAILGVGCGNPTALADLKVGETVLDLGAGAGIDVFLAANKVGPHGRVIGVDLTEDMVARGRQLAQEHAFANVEFRQGDIEHLPVDSATVDAIISNCVINLTPDKLASFKEIHRVLKPGGRILIADLVTEGPLPPDVRTSAAAWADCLAGAMPKAAYLETIRLAGFADVAVVSESPYEAPGMDERLQGQIISVKVRAVREDAVVKAVATEIALAVEEELEEESP
jgi:arsenite methyltransferase